MLASPSAASLVDFTKLSDPPLPVELWLAIFNGFSYAQLHKARAINRNFAKWVLSGQFDLELFRTPPVAGKDAFRRLLQAKGRLVFHPIFQHLNLAGPTFSDWLIRLRSAQVDGHRNGNEPSGADHAPLRVVGLANLAAMQENATYPPVLTLASLAIDIPESRVIPNVTQKEPDRPITVERVLRTLARILEERIYLPGEIDRYNLSWVQAYERSSGKISWRGEYTSPFWIMTEAFEPWNGRFSWKLDKRTGDISLVATGFRGAICRLSCLSSRSSR